MRHCMIPAGDLYLSGKQLKGRRKRQSNGNLRQEFLMTYFCRKLRLRKSIYLCRRTSRVDSGISKALLRQWYISDEEITSLPSTCRPLNNSFQTLSLSMIRKIFIHKSGHFLGIGLKHQGHDMNDYFLWRGCILRFFATVRSYLGLILLTVQFIPHRQHFRIPTVRGWLVLYSLDISSLWKPIHLFWWSTHLYINGSIEILY